MTQLELLAPAKNLMQGRAAIDHGADALYVGASDFGARHAAANTMGDIEALVAYAHLYRARVFATVNTLLFDDELEAALRLVRQLVEAGVDALIIQDLALLELPLPPVELHASTQMHNLTPEQVRFLADVGFRRVILAREASLDQIARIRAATDVPLETFVHGALCVSYSGRCYLSSYLTGRSGNRGCCTQPCRSSYDLCNDKGQVLVRDRHLLSLRDFSAARHLEALVAAGVTSFKIEGRLKDLSYVKNVTAFYRRLLDQLMEGRPDCTSASSGHTSLHFVPDVDRTFNRGYTDYFLERRQPMASFATPKSMGKKIGRVAGVGRTTLTLSTTEPLAPGDGLCFLTPDGRLEGFRADKVQGTTVVPNRMPPVKVGDTLWRNHDAAFDRMLQGVTAERRLAVDMELTVAADAVTLRIEDEEGLTAEVVQAAAPQAALNEEAALRTLQGQLGKLGGTPFALRRLRLPSPPPFLPASVLNEVRRQAVAALCERRCEAAKPLPRRVESNAVPYPEREVDYRANVVNHLSEAFYARHGARVTQRGPDQTADFDGVALMTTKYCLRYELRQCLRMKCNARVDEPYRGQLLLSNNGRQFRLRFDCERCEMQLLAADDASQTGKKT
ncbi:MAG: U32 family peptidase [Bacteroidales bacterium]|nr:U32 family peptidase [Bacteroidales bacterium]